METKIDTYKKIYSLLLVTGFMMFSISGFIGCNKKTEPNVMGVAPQLLQASLNQAYNTNNYGYSGGSAGYVLNVSFAHNGAQLNFNIPVSGDGATSAPQTVNNIQYTLQVQCETSQCYRIGALLFINNNPSTFINTSVAYGGSYGNGNGSSLLSCLSYQNGGYAGGYPSNLNSQGYSSYCNSLVNPANIPLPSVGYLLVPSNYPGNQQGVSVMLDLVKNTPIRQYTTLSQAMQDLIAGI